MNKKFVWVLALVLLFGVVCAQDPLEGISSEVPEAPVDSYEQFKTDFTDPSKAITAAQNNPELYMRYIRENPPAVAQNPQAYETVIAKDVKYINQNKEAFKAYAETKGASFTSIKGELKSFDKNIGGIETKGLAGEVVTSFSFNDIILLQKKGASNFRINDKGELAYDHTYVIERAGMDLLELSSVNLYGKVEQQGDEVYVSAGKVSVVGDINIELSGKNRARLITECKQAEGGCGLVEVEVVDKPIALPRGILQKGKATIMNPSSINLQENSKYQNKMGTSFQVTRETRITLQKDGCEKIKFSCINDDLGIFFGTLRVNAVDGNKISIDAKDGNYKNIIVKQITAPQPEKQLPARIAPIKARVLLKDTAVFEAAFPEKFKGKTVYVTDLGTFEYEDGSPIGYATDLTPEELAAYQEAKKSPVFVDAFKQAKDLASEEEARLARSGNTQVDLRLSREDSSKTRMVFSANKPISQGKLKGLKTNIAHVFSVKAYPPEGTPVIENSEGRQYTLQPDGNYKSDLQDDLVLTAKYVPGKGLKIIGASGTSPRVKSIQEQLTSGEGIVEFVEKEDKNIPWMIYDGEPSANTLGTIKEGISDQATKFANKRDQQGLQLLFGAFESLTPFESIEIAKNSKNADENILQLIIEKTEYQPGKRLANTMSILSSSDSPAAIKLQKKIIDEREEIYSFEVSNLLKVTKGKSELQKEILHKAKEIDNPGEALANVDSDDLRKQIITKSAKIYGYFYIGEEEIKLPLALNTYLLELKKLSPELQALAMQTLNFNEGVFVDPDIKGESFRRVLMFNENNPPQMKKVLERMPKREDIGFNPQLFSEVYFNPHFQEKTKELDFANKYSIALTAQRYLERRDESPTPEKIKEAVEAILSQRERFTNYNLLDKDTYYIPITHEEDQFENSKMVQLARDAGVRKIADPNLKGRKDLSGTETVKNKFLGFVEQSKEQGKTTIHFNNHGGPDHQWLSRGFAGSHESDDLHRPEAISYLELGDALIRRGNLGEVTVIIDSCYSNDFANNLYSYLHKKGAMQMPVVVSATNRGQPSWANFFSKAISNGHQKNKPLTGADLYRAESGIFLSQDVSVFMPAVSINEAKYSDPQTPRVIDTGSTTDAGAATTPQKPAKEPTEKLPAPLPPTVIEVAINEQERENKLAVG